MNSHFDIHDQNSWYFGRMSRKEAEMRLTEHNEVGVFLIRDSTTLIGDYALCVTERDSRIGNYIIYKRRQYGKVVYQVGDLFFPGLPELLAFYKLHYLDTTPLRYPLPKELEVYVGKYDFDGNPKKYPIPLPPRNRINRSKSDITRPDPAKLTLPSTLTRSTSDCDGGAASCYENVTPRSGVNDLHFKTGEHLLIVKKDGDMWWTAKNGEGKEGQVPVTFIEKLDVPDEAPIFPDPEERPMPIRTLPALARVTKAMKKAYDKSALQIEVGDIVTIVSIRADGQCEGELNGRVGHLPFNYIEFIEKVKQI